MSKREEKAINKIAKETGLKRSAVVDIVNGEFQFDERWKRIEWKGHILDYEISTKGRVRAMRTGEIIEPVFYGGHDYNNRYLHVSLKQGKEAFFPSVHRLVAEAFIPNPENKPQINHIDGIKCHNNVENLEWNTQSENMKHAIRTGLMKSYKGIDGRNTKNTEADVHKVCKLLEQGLTVREIAKQCGVTYAFVSGVKYNGNWADIRSQYKLPESVPHQQRTPEQIQMIDELIQSGNHNRKDILTKVGLPCDKTNISYVKYRHRVLFHPETINPKEQLTYRLARSSTTIDQHS